MLRNYVKIALKVFWRHKFLTAVNLFGICFTLAALMVAAAFIDQEVGPVPPEVHANRTLHLGWLFVKYSDEETFSSIRMPSYAFLDRYARRLKSAEKVTLFSEGMSRAVHGGAEESGVTVRLTDGAFWEVFRFDFLHGRPYTAAEIESGDRVAVIRAEFSRRLFGTRAAVGRSVTIDRRSYRVVGVVADYLFRRRTLADVWLPVTTAPPETWRTYKLGGDFKAAVLARRPGDMQRIRAEWAALVKQVEPPPDERLPFSGLSAPLLTTLEDWARESEGNWASAYETAQGTEEAEEAAAAKLRWRLLSVGGYMLLFMILPALHLVNLSIGRIEERTSEIGVRKSFGASTRTLVGQFVAENVLLTLMGGALCLAWCWGFLALAVVVMGTQIDAGVLARTFLYGLLLALVFGVLSGAYPAWRMARLHPVQALTGRES